MLSSLHRVVQRAGLLATRCLGCGVIVNSGQHMLCPACAQSLALRNGGYCPGCGDIFTEDEVPPQLCGKCRTDPQPWDNLYFNNRYAGKLRDLILGYKFNSGIGHTRLLATMAYDTFKARAERMPDIIVPVPLHPRRLLWRGYNQSTELCRTIAAKTHRPILHNGIIRTRHTRPQTRLGMRERKENIKGAFRANTSLVKGKTILLVDDVYTTGSTLRECTVTLKRAKAIGVDVLILARAMQ